MSELLLRLMATEDLILECIEEFVGWDNLTDSQEAVVHKLLDQNRDGAEGFIDEAIQKVAGGDEE